MKTRTVAALLVALLVGTAAQAQNLWAQNANFDRQFDQWLGALQRQNQQSQQALWQRHLQVNGPRLRAQYQQLVASGYAVGTFEQFAYWDLMTAGGTNVQGALQHQQDQFRGQQQAHATVMQGYSSVNQGWAQNSARQSAAVENHTNQAIRGVAPYVDPSTGRTAMLPHSIPQGQVLQSNGETYAQDPSGAYYRFQNNGWVRMNPVR